MTNVKAVRRMHETGPWDEHGNLRLPAWIQEAPPMPPEWPVWYFLAAVGLQALEDR